MSDVNNNNINQNQDLGVEPCRIIPMKRVPDLHPHDPYWDDVDKCWRSSDGRYDDEANDTRPEAEKYSSGTSVIVLMLLILAGLIYGLIMVMKDI